MKKVLLATRKKHLGFLPRVFLFLLTLASFTAPLPAGQVGQPSPVDNINFPVLQGIRNGVMTSGDACPTKEEMISKTRALQMPFIANNGQVDEQVRFYAKTFGGMVFVTRDGEIVYSLPSGRDVPAGASPSPSQQAHGDAHGCRGAGVRRSMGAEAQGRNAVFGWQGQAPLVPADAELVVANTCSPFLRIGNVNCPPERVLANALLVAYLHGLQKETTQRVVSTPATSNPGVLPANNNLHSKIQNPQSPARGVALKEHLVGAKIRGITGEQPAVTTVNYFTGNDKSKWKTNVPTFDMVNLGEVYKGIELSLKAYSENVEKLFCVKPGANPELIKVQLDGSKSIRVNKDGQLEADTELGLVKFTRPIAYQEIDGKRVEVACEYTIAEGVNNLEFGFWNLDCFPYSAFRILQSTTSDSPNPKSEYSFTVAAYDKTNDLIIDPLLASTFLGGTSEDYGNAIAIDASGCIYVTGYTYSPDFPMTSGVYNTSYNDNKDVFVSKLDSGLTSLLTSTYLGGSGDDCGNAILLDTNGNVYVAGTTDSPDFPTVIGAYQASSHGVTDVFISKLDSGLTNLPASTYLGGVGFDEGKSLALNTGGDVYVTGCTWSRDFPTSGGAYNTSFNDSNEAFVSRLDSGLTWLLASTYLGGSGWDEGQSLVLDANWNVYVTGTTDSTDFPTTSGAYHTSFNGSNDVFVSKLDGGLISLLASTYLGGSLDEKDSSLALDTSGNVYVTGTTDSTDFPTTSGAYDITFNGNTDVFISKLDGGVTGLLASTYLGGSGWDYGTALILDTSGNIYVTGDTDSTDFPTASGAYQASSQGNTDLFISKLSGGLTGLPASTYLGGSGWDYGAALVLDTSGNVYVTGYTSSSDFPMESWAYNTSFRGGYVDAFVSKLDVNLSAGICEYAISPSSQSYTASGGAGSVEVMVSLSSCGWMAASGASWITVTSGSNGTGDGAVGYSVSANTSTSPRTGVITIAGETFTVIQDGVSCAYAISPANQSFSSSGGAGSVKVMASSSRCSWTAASKESWITVTSGSNGMGDGAVGYSVSANTGTSLRTGVIDIAGETFTVTQEGICAYSILPTGQSFGSDGGSDSVGVSVSSNSCNWAAKSNASWITITSGGNGVGYGAVYYTVSANTGTSPRTGTMDIAGETFTVTQGAVCTHSISPSSQSFGSGGGTGSVVVTASSSSCDWTAQSYASWIAITSGSSGTGNGTVEYTVSANTGTSTRNGTLTIADQTFTVSEGVCIVKSITASSKDLTLNKEEIGFITITAAGADDCLAEGVTVTATINGKGKQLVKLLSKSQVTYTDGQTTFVIIANKQKGTAVIKFKAGGLNKVATVRVKIM